MIDKITETSSMFSVPMSSIENTAQDKPIKNGILVLWLLNCLS